MALKLTEADSAKICVPKLAGVCDRTDIVAFTPECRVMYVGPSFRLVPRKPIALDDPYSVNVLLLFLENN